MAKIINFEDFKFNKELSQYSDIFFNQMYDYFSNIVNTNIEAIKETLENAKTIGEFKLILFNLTFRMISDFMSNYSKEEILGIIEKGIIYRFQMIIKEIFTENQEVQDILLRLKR